MKSSKFNYYYTNSSKKNIIYNLLTHEKMYFEDIDSLYLIKNDDFEKLDNTILNQCRSKGILIDSDDELEKIKQKYYEGQKSHSILTITLAVTLQCNFRCDYCYENKAFISMDKESANLVLTFIEKELLKGYKGLNLIWFGGEPMMNFEIIKYLTPKIIALCNNLKLGLMFTMTTNGFLLNNERIKLLKKMNINNYYITIDGLENTHNKRRCEIHGLNSFKKIIENIKLMKNEGLNVIIRMNVDKRNIHEIDELRQYINTHLKVPFYLGRVQQFSDNCTNQSIYLTKDEYSHLILDFNLSQQNDGIQSIIKQPRNRSIFCRACNIGTFVIDPLLNLYKCENDIGNENKSIGNLKNMELIHFTKNAYLQWDPFQFDKCNNCIFLPLCVGGCPYNGLLTNESECENYKYIWKDYFEKVIL